MEEDPRALKPGICGVTKNSGKIEWICVKPVHAKIYQSRKGKMVYDNNPGADKHFFVNRYPNREKAE